MADTKVSALPLVSFPLNGDEYVPVVQGGTSKRMPLVGGGLWIPRVLAADQSNATTTATKVTGLDLGPLPAGTYQFQHFLRYTSSATTTGIKLDVNFTGTVTSFMWNWRWVDTGNVATATAAAAPDQDAIATTGHVVQGFASRAKGTAGRGVTASVDTANADMFVVIEGMMIVTVAGDLQLYHGSETAVATVMKAGSSVAVLKVG